MKGRIVYLVLLILFLFLFTIDNISFSESFVSNNPTIPLIGSDQTFWCWAACSQSILKYYNQAFNKRQCDFANYVFNKTICCYMPPLCNPCNKALPIAASIPRRSVQAVLKHFGGIDSYATYPLQIDFIKREIRNNRPFIVQLEGQGCFSHAAICFDYRGTSEKNFMIQLMIPEYRRYKKVWRPYLDEICEPGLFWTYTLILTTNPHLIYCTSIVFKGDYEGDGTDDIAIFRPDSGLWAIQGITRYYFGRTGDIPIPGDYNGDGTSEAAIYRAEDYLWAIRNLTRINFGCESAIPVPKDYTGDGTYDLAFVDSSSVNWRVKDTTTIYYGSTGDYLIPEDYDGDGCADIAIYRPSNGLWAVHKCTRFYFGYSDDIPVPSYYNRSENHSNMHAAIFRPSTGLWAIRGLTRAYFGESFDQPIPADHNGDLIDDIGIFRDGTGLWGVRCLSRVYFGQTGDIPITR